MSSSGCFGTYSPVLPSGGSKVTDTSVPVLCCGHPVMLFTGGDPCLSALLKTPDAQRALDLLALSGIKVMVKNCQGHFLTYTAPSFYPMKQFENMYLGFSLKPKG